MACLPCLGVIDSYWLHVTVNKCCISKLMMPLCSVDWCTIMSWVYHDICMRQCIFQTNILMMLRTEAWRRNITFCFKCKPIQTYALRLGSYICNDFDLEVKAWRVIISCISLGSNTRQFNTLRLDAQIYKDLLQSQHHESFMRWCLVSCIYNNVALEANALYVYALRLGA